MPGALEGIRLLVEVGRRLASRRHQTWNRLLSSESSGSTSLVNSARCLTAELEIVSVGLFSIFEGRLQDRVPGGPFFASLEKILTQHGRGELAQKLQAHYLAINVIKHGRGDSYRRLLDMSDDLPFQIKQPGEYFFSEGDVSEPEGLVCVSEEFLERMSKMLEEIYDFLVKLEGRNKL